uniref:VWFC domain-containing protein n=1 Tax=Bubo bubo TaxID=30461 RepID=A0A8C0FEM0_BUBBB
GYPKSILAPSPILQSLQHPPTLVLLPPGSGGPLLVPRGSPSPHLPAAAPGTQLPSSSPTPTTEPSPRAMGAPGTSTPSAPRCWYQGAPREPGARWMESGCRTCTCQGGRVLCEAVSCPVSCSHPLPALAGSCCPSCTGCLHDGVTRAEGDVFSPSDGNCTICVCLAGNVSCITPDSSPASWALNLTVLGSPRSLSSASPLQADGSVSCKRTDCVETCPYPIRIPGQCCPDCSAGDGGGGCFLEGCWSLCTPLCIPCLWSWADPEPLSLGSSSEVSQGSPNHLGTTAAPLLPTGCTYMGRIFYNNETFPSVLDPCLSCICLGVLSPHLVTPHHHHHPLSAASLPTDCNYQGRKVVNGQTFTPEGQPCTRCTCQLGEVSCEKRLCPHSCAELAALPAACCPPCQGNGDGWGLPPCPGQPIPTPNNPFCKEILPKGQSDPALAQLEAIPSCPGACSLVQETHPPSLHPPFREL